MGLEANPWPSQRLLLSTKQNAFRHQQDASLAKPAGHDNSSHVNCCGSKVVCEMTHGHAIGGHAGQERQDISAFDLHLCGRTYA